MARIIAQQSVSYDQTLKERSWRVELLTEIPRDELASWSNYPIVVHREHAELSDPTPPGGDVFYKGPIRPRGAAGRIEAQAGPPADGTDGTDPSHYTTPSNPFIPTVRFTMNDVIDAVDDQGNPDTIDLKDSAGNVLMADFPMAYVPLAIIAGIERMVDKKYAAEVQAAINRAVLEAQGLGGD